LPPFLVWFGVICIVGAFVAFSISKMPFGIGAVAKEIFACMLVLPLFWLCVSILHYLLPS
jgi:hypothetical protein